MATELFNFNISPDQKAKLMRRAALMTVETGKRVTMSDLLREAIEQVCNAPFDDAGGDGKTKVIKFTPIPVVKQAIDRAHLNSGKPIPEVINELLAQALELSL